ncbi:MAG: hypothetical protein V4738_04740 [Pseudomonadota bacterium]
MTPASHLQGAPVIDQRVVQNAHDVTRWAWLRDECTPAQLQSLGEAIQNARTLEDRQKAVEQVADQCVAELLLATDLPSSKLTGAQYFRTLLANHLPLLRR